MLHYEKHKSLNSNSNTTLKERNNRGKVVSLASLYVVYKQPIYILLMTPLQKFDKQYFHSVWLFVGFLLKVHTIISR